MSLIYDEDYSYYSSISKEIYQREIVEFDFYTCLTSTILASGAAGRWEDFLPNIFRQEVERIKGRVKNLKVWCASNKFLAIKDVVESV